MMSVNKQNKDCERIYFAVILTCDGSIRQNIWRTRLWLSIKIYSSLLYASSQEWNCLCVKTGNLCLGSLTFGISMKLQNWQILNLNFAIPAKPQYCIRVWNVRPSSKLTELSVLCQFLLGSDTQRTSNPVPSKCMKIISGGMNSTSLIKIMTHH